MEDRIVIDTNVILSGLWSKNGASFKLLTLLPENHFKVVISVPLILEYEAVLMKFREEVKLSKTDINNFLDYICSVGHHTNIYYLWRPVVRDPFDDHVLEVAVNSGSKYIVTYNIKDFEKSGLFGISAVKPKEYLEMRNLI